MPGYHSGNLARHLERKHPNVVAEHELLLENSRTLKIEIDQDLSEYIVKSGGKSSTRDPSKPQPPAIKRARKSGRQSSPAEDPNHYPIDHEQQYADPEPSPSATLTIAPIMTCDELVEHYLNIVVCDGMPITFLNGLASSALFSAFNQSIGLQTHIERDQLESMVLCRAQNERQMLIAEFYNRSGFSLILETIPACSSLAVLVQYYKEGHIQRYLLGVLPFEPHHTSGFKVKSALELCTTFGIEKQRVYALLFTTTTSTPTIGRKEDSPYHLPCLATLFTDTIADCVSQWQNIFDKMDIKTPASLEELVSELNDCPARGTQKLRLNREELKTLDAISEWARKASSVYENMNNPETCRVITDVVVGAFKFWIQTSKQVGTVPKALAQSLKTNFCNQVINYEPIRAAMFLDPRIQQLLSAEDKAEAKLHLKNLYHQLMGSEGGGGARVEVEIVDEAVVGEEEEGEEIVSRPDGEDDEDEDDDLTMFLKEKTKSGQKVIRSSSIDGPLQEFSSVPLLSAKSDLLTYWETSRQDAQLTRLAQVVHSVAAVKRNYVDSSYVGQVRRNDGIHSAELQEAIFFVGGNLRMTLIQQQQQEVQSASK